MRNSYRSDSTWLQLQQHLPNDYRREPGFAPSEESFRWRSSDIHVDRFANPASPCKVILHHGVGTNGRLLQFVAGGMLAYNVACETRKVSGFMGMCFIDARSPQARMRMSDRPRMDEAAFKMLDALRSHRAVLEPPSRAEESRDARKRGALPDRGARSHVDA